MWFAMLGRLAALSLSCYLLVCGHTMHAGSRGERMIGAWTVTFSTSNLSRYSILLTVFCCFQLFCSLQNIN